MTLLSVERSPEDPRQNLYRAGVSHMTYYELIEVKAIYGTSFDDIEMPMEQIADRFFKFATIFREVLDVQVSRMACLN